MNTTISTTIPVEVYEKISQNRLLENREKWAYNELILLGIQALEGDWESGIQKLQAKLTDLNAEIIVLQDKLAHKGEVEE
jgi:hypothetical protein